MFRVEYRTSSSDKAKWLLWTVTDDKSEVNAAVRRLKAEGAAEISVSETTHTVIFHWERSNGVLTKP